MFSVIKFCYVISIICKNVSRMFHSNTMWVDLTMYQTKLEIYKSLKKTTAANTTTLKEEDY